MRKEREMKRSYDQRFVTSFACEKRLMRRFDRLAEKQNLTRTEALRQAMELLLSQQSTTPNQAETEKPALAAN